ncbi:8571_t:CDS:2 [Diversispora eburnea]|uniref:8571_t:CDS:1 n=1 Tax=Diversispora eburnea TaxID=1213867 RepID=A0A9N8VE73_9GLOM|nr:8571_t:CDS:2 [Diversispora eburnea]
MRLRRTCKLLNELIIIVINDEIFITYNLGWAIASLYYYKFIKNTACELTSYDYVNNQFCFTIINEDQEFKCGENLFVHLFWNDELVYYGSCYNVGESDDDYNVVDEHNFDDHNVDHNFDNNNVDYNDDEQQQQRELFVKGQEDQGNDSKQQIQWVFKEIKFHNSALGIKRGPKKGTYQITYVKIGAIEIYKRLDSLDEINHHVN